MMTSNSKILRKKLNTINGIDNVLFWSDIMSEISFIVPNGALNTNKDIKSQELTTPSPTKPVQISPSSNSPLSSTSSLNNTNLDEKFKFKYQSVPNDLKVVIIWLEQIQDADNIPIDDIIQETFAFDSTAASSSHNIYKPKEITVIFVHPLGNKLNRIITWSNTNKKYFYTIPLIDGMVVSSRMLSTMIRQTVLNIFRRKRLEIDDYQPPHVKRKNKITEIVKKFQIKKSEPDLFTSLLMGY